MDTPQLLELLAAGPVIAAVKDPEGLNRALDSDVSVLFLLYGDILTIRDTVAALRLDAVLAAGFSTSRSKAADLISAGRVAINHRECMKGDRTVNEGDVLTCRGLGKCVVKEVLGASRKGRIMLVLERYQ